MRHAAFLLALLTTGPALAQNGCISLTNGMLGGAEIPYAPQHVPQSGLTVEAWITYDGTTLIPGWAHPTLIRQKVGGGQEAFFVRVNARNVGDRVLSFAIQTQQGTLSWVNWTFQLGQLLNWTHVAATYDGAMQRLYVNGMEVASAPGNGMPLLDQGGLLHIGKGDPGSTNNYYEVWNGQIDEIRLWPFARTAAEIQQTMNQELNSIPGRVSTWNLNGQSFGDSSSTSNGTQVGSVTWMTNGPALASFATSGVATVGASTPGCDGAIEATLSSLPQAGNMAFAMNATPFVPGAPVAFVFSGSATRNPFQVAGLSIWVDLLHPAFFIAPALSDGLGAARFPLPIPASAPSGATFAGQFVSIDPCGPQGLTISDALTGVVL